MGRGIFDVLSLADFIFFMNLTGLGRGIFDVLSLADFILVIFFLDLSKEPSLHELLEDTPLVIKGVVKIRQIFILVNYLSKLPLPILIPFQ